MNRSALPDANQDGIWGSIDMAIIFRATKGANLSPDEVDGNFHDLDDRVAELEDNPLQPVEIEEITLTGSQLLISMSNGDSFGPFTVPTATMHWRGNWAATTLYVANDLLIVPFNGLYLVRLDHTTGSEFDPSLAISTVSVYVKVLSLPGFPTMNWKGDYAADTDYVADDVFYVADDGSYIVLIDHTSDDVFDPDALDVFTSEPLYRRLIPAASVSAGSGDANFWAPVDLAPRVNVALTGEQTLDGVMSNLSRVLLFRQTNKIENGIWRTDPGAWTREPDADADSEFTPYKQATAMFGAHGGLVFYMRNNVAPVVGTDNIIFAIQVPSDYPRIYIELTVASVTLQLSHRTRLIRMNSASAQEFIMDGLDGFPNNREFSIQRVGAGSVTIEPDVSLTIEKPDGMSFELEQYAIYRFYKVSPTRWVMSQGVVGSDGVRNNSGVAGSSVSDALETLAVGVTSLAASDIANDSGVSGTTVSDALDALAADTSSLAASDISNDSGVAGADVKDALDQLNSDILAIGGSVGATNFVGLGDVPHSYSAQANKLVRVNGAANGLEFLALDTDGALAANSDTVVASQKALKTYIDQIVAAMDAMVFKGVIDASANPNYPAADRGHTYRISVAGKIGGASGVNVEAGDLIICLDDATSAGTQAAQGAHWTITQTNLDGAVIGPASVTDAHFCQFDGTTGKLIKGGIALDTDTALAANSDTRLGSQKAIKAYIDAAVANVLKSNATATLTKGFTSTGFNAGTKSSGTYTPDPADGNMQYGVNGGAFTLAAPTVAGDYSIIVQITNNGSAGAITFTGFSVTPTGDTLTTTNGDDFFFFITKLNGFISLNKLKLQ
jgi:hypothetical protein